METMVIGLLIRPCDPMLYPSLGATGLGAALLPGDSPFDADMDKEAAPAGQQKDLGSTALRMLKQVVAVPELKLGTHARLERTHPFLKLYWG